MVLEFSTGLRAVPTSSRMVRLVLTALPRCRCWCQSTKSLKEHHPDLERHLSFQWRTTKACLPGHHVVAWPPAPHTGWTNRRHWSSPIIHHLEPSAGTEQHGEDCDHHHPLYWGGQAGRCGEFTKSVCIPTLVDISYKLNNIEELFLRTVKCLFFLRSQLIFGLLISLLDLYIFSLLIGN